MVIYKFTVYGNSLEDLRRKTDQKIKSFHPNFGPPVRTNIVVEETTGDELVAHVTAEYNYA